MKTVFMVSGPSATGKGALLAALREFAGACLGEAPVIRSKESRPNGPRTNEQSQWDDERYFRSAADIDLLKSDPAYIVGTCRGLPQAIDLNEIRSNACDTMVMEVYYTLCKGKTIDGVKTVPLFISPFSKAGLDAVSENDIIKEMLTRQLWRAVYLGEKTVAIEDIILRVKDAPKEIAVLKKTADHIIECPGEDACEWNRYANGIFRAAPTGKAAKALAQLAGIINMEGR